MIEMASDRRKAFTVKKDCYYVPELKLISFKCRVCLKKCELGEEIMKAVDRLELNEYHRKFETE